MEMTTYTGKKKQKFSRKSARKCQRHLKHKFLSENFIDDTLNVLSKSKGEINIRIM